MGFSLSCSRTEIVVQLAKSEQASYLSLLQLFAYGTFEDYLSERSTLLEYLILSFDESFTSEHKSTLPALSEAQLTKLKLLSLVSLSLQRRVSTLILLACLTN